MKFVKYDSTNGNIISSGEMPDDAIDYLNSQGQNLIKTGNTLYPLKGFKVNLETKEIYVVSELDSPVSPDTFLSSLKNAIKAELLRTDYTQALDALSHIPAEKIEAYKTYRQLLRNALDKTTFQDMLLSAPSTTPDGDNKFDSFRGLMPPPTPSGANVSEVVVSFDYSNSISNIDLPLPNVTK